MSIEYIDGIGIVEYDRFHNTSEVKDTVKPVFQYSWEHFPRNTAGKALLQCASERTAQALITKWNISNAEWCYMFEGRVEVK